MIKLLIVTVITCLVIIIAAADGYRPAQHAVCVATGGRWVVPGEITRVDSQGREYIARETGCARS